MTTTEMGTLVRRDHDELLAALRAMGDPLCDPAHHATLLDGVMLGFAAHVEAEHRALQRVLEHATAAPAVYFLVSQVMAAHLAQEAALDALLAARPGTPVWRDRAAYLRDLISHHAEQEAACLHPALPDHAPAVHRSLAGTYATERLRALSTVGFVEARPLRRSA